jgi:endonuclease-3
LEVVDEEGNGLEDAIRCGGLAATKAARIRAMLRGVKEKRGAICLEYLRELSVDEVKRELSQFKGIGPKTVSCMSFGLFPLQCIFLFWYDPCQSKKTEHLPRMKSSYKYFE